MSDLSFTWPGKTSLAAEIAKPLERISFEFSQHERPMRTTLWRPGGIGLRIQSEMHDLAERLEVGVLCFDLVSAPAHDEKIVDLDSTFLQPLRVSKLVLSELGKSVESGLLIQSIGGEEILIVASAFPCFLAVRGVLSLYRIFDPEYPLNRYQVIPVTG
jgi:hypothetical protein